MAITTTTTRLTFESLMKKSKRDLAHKCLMLCDLNEFNRRLLRELDAEMDGVKVPASAAAILNTIRTMVNEDD